ncbi:MAG: hypothetical protein AB1489_40420 [Acidobacteriota bacterium]
MAKVTKKPGVIQKEPGIIQRKGEWSARITFKDETGKRCWIMRKAANISQARDIKKELLRKLEQQGEKFLKAEKITFNERAFFGDRKLRSITHADLERYKAKRLATPTAHGKEMSLNFVNKDLSKLRRMFNIAHREG